MNKKKETKPKENKETQPEKINLTYPVGSITDFTFKCFKEVIAPFEDGKKSETIYHLTGSYNLSTSEDGLIRQTKTNFSAVHKNKETLKNQLFAMVVSLGENFQ